MCMSKINVNYIMYICLHVYACTVCEDTHKCIVMYYVESQICHGDLVFVNGKMT